MSDSRSILDIYVAFDRGLEAWHVGHRDRAGKRMVILYRHMDSLVSYCNTLGNRAYTISYFSTFAKIISAKFSTFSVSQYHWLLAYFHAVKLLTWHVRVRSDVHKILQYNQKSAEPTSLLHFSSDITHNLNTKACFASTIKCCIGIWPLATERDRSRRWRPPNGPRTRASKHGTTELLLQISLAAPSPVCGHSFGCNLQSSYSLLTACLLEPQTVVRKDFTNMEKAPTWAFSWLDAPTKEVWLA